MGLLAALFRALKFIINFNYGGIVLKALINRMKVMAESWRGLCLLAVMVFFITSGSAAAQLRPGGSGSSSGPISISSDRLETDETQGMVSFIGAVVGRQGEMTITCDLMKIFYVQNEKIEAKPVAADSGDSFGSSDRQIERVECEGNVKVVEGDRLAVGDKALYLVQSIPRRIILTGQARVWQGRDSVTGHQVTYFLDENRSVVESGAQPGRQRERVRTIYHQKDAK